jgi:hypothetical protein
MLGVAATSAAAADEARKPIDLTLQWHVSLDASGQVVSMKPIEDRNAELYRRLDPEVRGWHFSAGRVDGASAPAETTLTVNLRLDPVADGYRVNLRGAGAGGAYATTTAPKYPDGALMSYRGGGVLLRVDYDAEGRVTDASVVGAERRSLATTSSMRRSLRSGTGHFGRSRSRATRRRARSWCRSVSRSSRRRSNAVSPTPRRSARSATRR